MSRWQRVVAVGEASQVGEARRAAAQIAESAGLGDTDRGRVAIIVTELATNLVRHARGGEILLRGLVPGPGVEILSVDRGPGMADVAACMRDGFSTGGTAGTGLGAVRRQSSFFDIHSAPPAGTVVVSRVGQAANGTTPAASRPEFDWAVVCVPLRGETACGDTWRVAEAPGRLSILLADGLGHGPLAAEAAEAAGAAFDADPFAGPRAILEAAHVKMHGTRGGAVAVLQWEAAVARFAGIGNIAGSIVTHATSRGLTSHNGTAGVQVRKIQEFDYPLAPGATLVMHSDGLQGRWTFDALPGAARRHPSVVAALLYRDFARGRDDVTVAVVRAADA
jgi:anti-sigma regulatory factor (Ser/Thr protein kinase)